MAELAAEPLAEPDAAFSEDDAPITPARTGRSRGGRGRGRSSFDASAEASAVAEIDPEPLAEDEAEPTGDFESRDRNFGRGDRGGRDRNGRNDRGGRGRIAAPAGDDLESEIDRALQEQRGIPPRTRLPAAEPVEAREAPRRDSDRGGRDRGGRTTGGTREARPQFGREAGPSGEFNRRQIPERPRVQQVRGGSMESQVARQNVLFEEFTQQQSQTLREVQRLMSNMARGNVGAGAASGGALMALPKVGIFLDVPNLIYAAEQIGARIHFGKLLDFLTEGRQLVRATAYAPITDDPSTRFESQRFVQPVLNNGYKIVTKPWKRFADGGMKANFDIELAVDILTMSDRLDIVVLLSGDGDFRRVCELVESKGVRVEVVSFQASTAMELRAVADSYIDLGGILHMLQP